MLIADIRTNEANFSNDFRTCAGLCPTIPANQTDEVTWQLLGRYLCDSADWEYSQDLFLVCRGVWFAVADPVGVNDHRAGMGFEGCSCCCSRPVWKP